MGVDPPEDTEEFSPYEEEDEAPAATSLQKDEGQDRPASSIRDTPKLESWADDAEDPRSNAGNVLCMEDSKFRMIRYLDLLVLVWEEDIVKQKRLSGRRALGGEKDYDRLELSSPQEAVSPI